MTGLRAGLVVVALIGIVAPFKVVQLILQRMYAPQVTGVPIPLLPSIAGYGLALVISTVVCYFCYKFIKQDREPTDNQDGLDKSEELYY